MSLKICYNNSIHKVSKLPEDFTGLLNSIRATLHEDLPTKFALRYEDAEGDRVVIHNDQDYKLAIESELSNSNGSNSKSLKIFLSDAADDLNNTSFITKAVVDEVHQQQRESIIPQPEEVVVQAPSQEKEEEKVNPTTETETKPNEADDGFKVVGPRKLSCKKHKCERKQQEKSVKKITQETLQEELPTIALIIKQLIEEDDSEPKEFSSKKHAKHCKRGNRKASGGNTAMHYSVYCDNCGAHPLVGNRYKCTVLPDFDLCENCEARVEHKYPLIKIRDESQYVYVKDSAIHQEKEAPRRSSCHRRQHCKRQKEENFQNLVNDIIQQTQPIIAEVISADNGSIPPCFGNLSQVFGNSGLDEVLKSFGMNFNFKDFMPKEESPKQEEASKQKAPKEDSHRAEHLHQEKPAEVPKPVAESVIVEKKEEVPSTQQKKKYIPEVTKLAQAILEIFPQSNVDDVCEYITQRPKASFEQLVLDFMSSL